MKIHRSSSPQKMVDAFNARIEQLGGQEDIASSVDVMSSSTEVIDEELEDITGDARDSEFIVNDEDDEPIAATFDVNSIDLDKLYDVIDKYNATSRPVSGDWDSETADEQQTIADAFNISLDDAKEVMIQILGFPADDNFIAASTTIECHEYIDETGDAFGEPGMIYTEDELRKYFESNRFSDPVLEGYDTFEDWLTETLDNTNLRFESVDGGCHVDVEGGDDLGIDLPEWDEEDDGLTRGDWEELDHKYVYDTDGFTTDYTLYFNTVTGQYVTVFGDRELYNPEDSDFDMEFDSEQEARDWFESYNTDEYAE